MEVDATDGTLNLVEADVVEPFEAGAGNGLDAVVGHKEGFLPPHEDVLPLGIVLEGEVRLLGQPRKGTPGWESGPVVHICLFSGAPVLMTSLEGMFGADYLALKESC